MPSFSQQTEDRMSMEKARLRRVPPLNVLKKVDFLKMPLLAQKGPAKGKRLPAGSRVAG